MILALVVQKDWKLLDLDVKMMFLNGNLLEEVYMNHPQGFPVFGKEKKKVCQLQKALYV
jgi:hypothetical protein